MSKKLPLTDFRAVRSMLEPHEFANSEGQDVAPSDPVDEDVWDGIMHLPEDVSIRISDHNGKRLKLLHSLWADWIMAVGDDPEKPDELYNCMLEAADCFQCANFNFLHGYYRAAVAELRVAFELVMIGTYGNLKPTDEKYTTWKMGAGELSFTRCRKNLSEIMSNGHVQWMFNDGELLATAYRRLCNYTHSRPGTNYGALWESNGPVYNNQAIRITFLTFLSVVAICYLLVRLARPRFTIPKNSAILFELEWISDHHKLVLAFTELYGKVSGAP
jgi:hypothetical protein